MASVFTGCCGNAKFSIDWRWLASQITAAPQLLLTPCVHSYSACPPLLSIHKCMVSIGCIDMITWHLMHVCMFHVYGAYGPSRSCSGIAVCSVWVLHKLLLCCLCLIMIPIIRLAAFK